MDFKILSSLAAKVGLKALSAGKMAALSEDSARLKSWQTRGLAAEMSYMQRQADSFGEPFRLLPEAKSYISFAVQYDCSNPGPLPPGFGRVARYAWGPDYHQVIETRLESLVNRVEELLGRKILYRLTCDAAPILERALARISGLGFIGRNSLLIRKNVGSFLFLAEVLWDLELEDPAPVAAWPESSPCGNCPCCRRDCPTNALVEDYVVDAGRCISYLTIEKRAAFSLAERKAIGEWVLGCDICQEVCPFNHKALALGRPAELPELLAREGGPFLELKEVLSLRSQEKFAARFSKTALFRAKRAGLLRNAACVAANTAASECAPALVETAALDPSGLVRQHALWALTELQRAEGELRKGRVKAIIEAALEDKEDSVRREARELLEIWG
jgi:epoxyqueuosine reductase